MRRASADTRPALRLACGAAALAVLAGLLLAAARAAAPEPEGGHPAAGAPESGEPAKHDHAAGGHAEHEPDALEHVMDEKEEWHLFHSFGPPSIKLPSVSFELGGYPVTLRLTKFMILEVIAAVLIALIYIPLARRLASGQPAKGAFQNTFEVLLTFVREEIAKPGLGEHDADRFVPFLWTLFLFILFNNLLGLIPLCGSATANIYVTGGLALCVFFVIHGSAIAKMGAGHYLQSLWPDMDVPFPLGYILKPLVFLIEISGVLVRNLVLAVRLFANMFAGHVVLATILIFIYLAGKTLFVLWATITVSSVLGQVVLSLLELFIAFLQAYIFTFLTSLFMGLAMHPQH
jgi:F-type H+-transporting ATPase subunit a